MISKLFGNRVVEKTLDATWARNEAISHNVANVDTPNYKRKTVSFEEYLDQSLDKSGFRGFRTDRRHIPIGGGNVDDVDIKVTEDNKSLSMRLDGNNVDIEQEMADMAKNTIRYDTLIQRMNAGFKKMKSVISEGRR